MGLSDVCGRRLGFHLKRPVLSGYNGYSQMMQWFEYSYLITVSQTNVRESVQVEDNSADQLIK